MKLTVLGAAKEVTGSCYLIQAGDATLMLECGQIQGRKKDEIRNFDDLPVSVADIDAVILSHAHIDHSGRIPLLVKKGYTGPIYTHRASQALCEIMLLDSGYIHEKDAEWENKRRRKKGQKMVVPLYTRDDAQDALQFFVGLGYAEEKEILPGIRVRLLDAGHILGAAIVELSHEQDGATSKLVFSGDLGYKYAPVMEDPAVVESADVVMMESTYGDRLHRDYQETLRELKEVFEAARDAGGNILIPAFAVGRTQDLLYLLATHYDEWDLSQWRIFLDSPMAIRTTETYARYDNLYEAPLFNEDGKIQSLPNLVLTLSTEESMTINEVRSGAIIIAGSGMCTGGRIHHHLKNNISRAECHIIMIGYQAQGTLGRKIVDGAEEIKLWGEKRPVRATVHTVGGLSAHADQSGLMDWYANFHGAPPVYLVHGEEKAQVALGEALKQRFNCEVAIPNRGDVIAIDATKG